VNIEVSLPDQDQCACPQCTTWTPARRAATSQTHSAKDSSTCVSRHLRSRSRRRRVQDDRWQPLLSDDVRGLCRPQSQQYQTSLTTDSKHISAPHYQHAASFIVSRLDIKIRLTNRTSECFRHQIAIRQIFLSQYCKTLYVRVPFISRV